MSPEPALVSVPPPKSALPVREPSTTEAPVLSTTIPMGFAESDALEPPKCVDQMCAPPEFGVAVGVGVAVGD
jgi:hypothetical protein